MKPNFYFFGFLSNQFLCGSHITIKIYDINQLKNINNCQMSQHNFITLVNTYVINKHRQCSIINEMSNMKHKEIENLTINLHI